MFLEPLGYAGARREEGGAGRQAAVCGASQLQQPAGSAGTPLGDRLRSAALLAAGVGTPYWILRTLLNPPLERRGRIGVHTPSS